MTVTDIRGSHRYNR